MKRSKEDTEISKLRILLAAEEEFCQRGFSAASVDSIAKSAKITKSAIFWHFENKAGLFRATIQRAISRVKTIFEESFLSPNGIPVMERCRDVIKKIKKDHAFEVLLALGVANKTGDTPKELIGECNSQMSYFLKDTIKYFEDACKQGKMSLESDIAAITMTVMLVMGGFSYFSITKSLIDPIGKNVTDDDIINVLFSGLLSFQKAP